MACEYDSEILTPLGPAIKLTKTNFMTEGLGTWLTDLPGVELIPHMGSATFEGRQAMTEKVIANNRVWADGHRPPAQVFEVRV